MNSFYKIFLAFIFIKLKCCQSESEVETLWGNLYNTCRFQQIGNRNPYGYFNLKCIVDNIYVTKHSDFYFKFVGHQYAHSIEQAQQYTQEIEFLNSTMNYLPYSLFKQLPNIKKFTCEKCQLLELKNIDLNNADSLVALNLTRNYIGKLEKNNFIAATNLKSIDLSFNHIETVDSNAFKGLTQLTKLNLRNNYIKTIQGELLNKLIALQILDLSHNKIENTIDANFLVNNKDITHLSLNNNKITKVTSDAFLGLQNLTVLLLNGNELRNLDLSTTGIIIKLDVSWNQMWKLNVSSVCKSVFASYNKISDLVFINQIMMNVLELQYNQLKDFSFVSEMKNLVALDLSHNPLTSFNHSVFKELTKLKTLFLENINSVTNLQFVNYETFGHLINLHTLDISFNYLSEINLNVFSLVQLTSLFIDGNNLTEINDLPDFKMIFPKLTRIGISFNHFTCQYLRKLFYVFAELNVEIYLHDSHFVQNQPNFRGVNCIDNSTKFEKQEKNLLSTIIPLAYHQIAIEDITEISILNDSVAAENDDSYINAIEEINSSENIKTNITALQEMSNETTILNDSSQKIDLIYQMLFNQQKSNNNSLEDNGMTDKIKNLSLILNSINDKIDKINESFYSYQHVTFDKFSQSKIRTSIVFHILLILGLFCLIIFLYYKFFLNPTSKRNADKIENIPLYCEKSEK